MSNEKSILELNDDYLGSEDYVVKDDKPLKLDWCEYCIHDIIIRETKNGKEYLNMVLKAIEHDFAMYLTAYQKKDGSGYAMIDFDKVIQAVLSGLPEVPVFKTKMQAVKFIVKKNVALKFKEEISAYNGEMQMILSGARASKFGNDKPAF